MSTVPAEIAGIGSSEQKLRATPGFDPLKAGLGPEEYFVWSRISGFESARQILLATGLPIERGVTILSRLRWIGAIMLPGESEPPVPATRAPELPPQQMAPPPPRTMTPSWQHPPGQPPTMPRTSTPAAAPPARNKPTTQAPPLVARTATASRAPASSPVIAVPRAATPVAKPAPAAPPVAKPAPAAPPVAKPAPAAPAAPPPAKPDDEMRFDLRLANATRDELLALAEDVELDDRERRLILALRRLIDKNDPHALLGASGDADKRALKRAYFKLSKEIHPDRYYGKRLGTFAERMVFVFEAVNRAYTSLTTAEKQRANGATRAEEPQTPTEYAAEIFDRACALEVGGDPLEAMKLFAATVRVDPQTRYLRRAANCALAANQPKTAVEYAKKAQMQAPYDVSSARLLASAFRAAGKLADAEEVLVMAMAMKSENDVLTAELRHDLAEVRNLLAAAP